MFDRSLGKSARMNRTQMSERIKFVSNYLGLDYAPGVNRRVTKSVNQIKDEHLAAANTKRLELAKVKDLKAEVKKLKTEIKLTQTNHKELRIFEKELHSKIKAKDLSIEDMQHQVATLKNTILQEKKEKEHFKSVVELKVIENIDTKNVINALQEQKDTLEVKVHDLEEKIVSRPNMKQYEAQKQEIKTTNSDFREIHAYFDMPKEEIKTQKGVFAWIKTKFIELKDRILGLEDENKKLKTQNEELKSELQSKETTILGLENANKLQEWEIEELKEKINSNPKKSPRVTRVH